MRGRLVKEMVWFKESLPQNYQNFESKLLANKNQNLNLLHQHTPSDEKRRKQELEGEEEASRPRGGRTRERTYQKASFLSLFLSPNPKAFL